MFNNQEIAGVVQEKIYVEHPRDYQILIQKFTNQGIKELHIKAILESALESDPEFDEEAAEIAYLLGARADLGNIVVDYAPSLLGKGVNLIFTATILKEQK